MRRGAGVTPEQLRALAEGLDRIGAGEGHQIEAGERSERGIEGRKRGGRGNLDGGNQNRSRAQRAQPLGELRGLTWRAGDQDAPARESKADGSGCFFTTAHGFFLPAHGFAAWPRAMTRS